MWYDTDKIHCIYRGRSWSQEMFADYESLCIKYWPHGKNIGGSIGITFQNLQQLYLSIFMSSVSFRIYCHHICIIVLSLKVFLLIVAKISSHIKRYEGYKFISYYFVIIL